MILAKKMQVGIADIDDLHAIASGISLNLLYSIFMAGVIAARL
jgi:hypothetical protein